MKLQSFMVKYIPIFDGQTSIFHIYPYTMIKFERNLEEHEFSDLT